MTSIRIAREQVLKGPTSAAAWGNLGEVFLANELEDEARICFIEAGRLKPNDYRWPYLEAVIFINHGDKERALPYLRRSVELAGIRDDDNLAPRLMLAEVLLLLGQTKEAEPDIRFAMERKPADPRGQFDAGLLAMATQDWEAARTHFQRCLESPYSRQQARVQLAAVCRRVGDLVKAEEYQSEIDRVPPDWSWPDPVVESYLFRAVKKRNCYKIAEGMEAQGRFLDAVRILTPVADEYPNDDVAQVFLGRLLAQLGDFPRAEPRLRSGLQLAPHKIQPHYLLSILLIQEGENRQRNGDKARAAVLFREAMSLARAALVIKPDYGFAFMALGLALKNLGESAEAATALQQAVHCNPEYAEMHLRLAEVLDSLDRREQARDRYAQALRLAPLQIPWRLTAQRRLDELLKVAKKAGG